jgi:hypothetical protein
MGMILVKWIGTILCLIGILLTALNIYPANIFIGFIGSGLWAAAGYAQDDMPLFIVEIVAVAFYFVGIVLFITGELTKWGIL